MVAGCPPNIDLWVVDREAAGRSEPHNLGVPLNTPAAGAYSSLASDGTLYFSSGRPGGKGGAELYRSQFVDGHYAESEKYRGHQYARWQPLQTLGTGVNGAARDYSERDTPNGQY
ncbi:MAG: hypothetical protein ABIS07_13465 [Dokdonella sp.]